MTLLERARSGVRWATAAQIVVALLGIAQLAALSRLLDAVDFGLAAMAMVPIGFAQLFADLGLSASVIHHQTMTRQQLSTLYWLNVLVGVAMSFGLALLASVLAHFEGMPGLEPLLIAFAPIFLINALGTQFRVLQRKALNFDRLAKVDIASAIASLVSGVMAALAGCRAHSLVIATLAGACTGAMLNLSWGLRWQRPGACFSVRSVAAHLRFGGFRVGEDLLNYIHGQADIFLVGRLLGAEALGLYSVAKNICMRPSALLNPVFSEVAFPIMARIQHDREALCRGYLKGLRMLTSMTAPIYLVMAVGAEPLVLIVLGERWLAVVPVMRVLALCWLLRSTGSPVGSLLLATGRVAYGFYWNCLALLVIVPITYFGISIGGVMGAAFSASLVQLLIFVPLWWFLVRPSCGATARHYFGGVAGQIAIAFVAVMIAAQADWLTGGQLWSSLVTLVGCTALLQAYLVYRLDKPTWQEFMALLSMKVPASGTPEG